MRVGRLELHPHRTGLSRSGDTLTLLGTVEPANPDWRAVAVSREQILGMDGQLVGVSWPHDGRMDGFWRVMDARVDARNLIGTRARMEWQLGLARAAHGPVDFESQLTGAAMVNDHSVLGDTPWVATPAGVSDLYADPPPTGYDAASEDGVVRVWLEAPRHATWALPPDKDASAFYAGAVTVRQNLAVVTGRMVRDAPGIFEMSNGLCRVRWVVGEAAWDSLDGAWDDMGDLTWDDLGGFTGVEVATWHDGWVRRQWDVGVAPTMCTVVRNEPHVATVRLIEPAAPSRRVLDLTLRRGARAVYGHTSGPEEARAVMRESAEAAESIAGGVKAASPDGDGVSYVAATTGPLDRDLTQGGFTTDTSRVTFMVGATAGGADQTPEAMVAQWVSHRDETVRPVLR